MDIFTLAQNTFTREDVLDEFTSAIWTERFTELGDVTITGDPQGQLAQLVGTGSLLALDGSDEVMVIETVLEEEGLLKASGRTITSVMEERIFRAHRSPSNTVYGLDDMSGPAEAMTEIVRIIMVDGTFAWTPYQKITNMSIGDYDDPGGNAFSVLLGDDTVYNHVKQLADTYQVGFRIRLGTLAGHYELYFDALAGRDLTTDQNVYPAVRFSPNLDSLNNIKRLESNSGYKTIVYAFAPDYDDGVNPPSTLAPAHAQVTGGLTATDLYRRELMIEVSDATFDNFGSAPAIDTYLGQKAKDALANNNYTKVIDGEVVPQNQFKYGQDYKLGDIIELGAGDGIVQTARITEYIRSHDQEGDRAWPSVSVI